MAIKEVFKNPTVRQVLFQIVYPSFFAIESKIGDYQLKIMERFPKSALLIQNRFLITQTINQSPIENQQRTQTKKIWQFKTQEEDVTVNISSDTLDIVSEKHKTYNNETSENKFRDSIQFVMGKFLEVIPLIMVSRVGLRYIDDCPLPDDLTKESFYEYYNSFINMSNIPDIKGVDLLDFTSVVRDSELILRYKETLQKVNDKYKFSLDFDGQISNFHASSYLSKTDAIHHTIANWYEKAIKEPVIKIMQS